MCIKNRKRKELLGFLRVISRQTNVEQGLLPCFYVVSNKCYSTLARKLSQTLFDISLSVKKILHQEQQVYTLFLLVLRVSLSYIAQFSYKFDLDLKFLRMQI